MNIVEKRGDNECGTCDGKGSIRRDLNPTPAYGNTWGVVECWDCLGTGYQLTLDAKVLLKFLRQELKRP